MQMADQAKLEQFMGKMVGDMGAAVSAALIIVGDKLGLYKALAKGPATSLQLADRTGTTERYVREWLNAQAASGYVDYDPKTGAYSLNAEQEMVFAREEEPTFMAGGFEVVAAMYRDEPKITEAFRTGNGVGWHEHDACLFRGTERFFRVGYNANLVSAWLPALEGVTAKLEQGGKVADIGCGHGASTVIMAKAFPKSEFHGFDYHQASIERAEASAREGGVAANTRFARASAQAFPGSGYDLVTIFDALHDMGDPVAAARHIRQALKPDGTFMLVEPFANDRAEDNHNPVGRIFYSASTMICTPASYSQEGRMGLGAQAGEARLKDVCMQAGFTRFRRAAETPFNLIFEVRP
jgi:2-polyprenyl-3-methyl-5-hydroxy-6-metoxy-1,4-benzoquinol methylase